MKNLYVISDNDNGLRGVFTSKKNAFHAFIDIANDSGQKDMKIYHEGKMRDFKPYMFRGSLIQIDFINEDGDRCEFTVEQIQANHY